VKNEDPILECQRAGKKRRGQLKELINKHRVDVFYLQETMKIEFTLSELRNLVDGQNFSWNWSASQGHLGGSLIGVKQGYLDAEEMDEGKFFSSVRIRNREGDFCWEAINVYDPVQLELKGQFLQELYGKLKRTGIPVMVIGGGVDFNLLRYVHEKSNGSEYTVWMDMFNFFINDTALIEVVRGGSRFTWTNK
jgi:exonuclease III